MILILIYRFFPPGVDYPWASHRHELTRGEGGRPPQQPLDTQVLRSFGDSSLGTFGNPSPERCRDSNSERFGDPNHETLWSSEAYGDSNERGSGSFQAKPEEPQT